MATILVVDDEFAVLDALAALLTDEGHSVVTASNGVEGLAALARTPAVQMVLLDVMMPEMDGPSMVRAMQKDPRFAGIPVVGMSAAREAPEPVGWAAFLRKPFALDALLDVVARLTSPHAPPAAQN